MKYTCVLHHFLAAQHSSQENTQFLGGQPKRPRKDTVFFAPWPNSQGKAPFRWLLRQTVKKTHIFLGG